VVAWKEQIQDVARCSKIWNAHSRLTLLRDRFIPCRTVMRLTTEAACPMVEQELDLLGAPDQRAQARVKRVELPERGSPTPPARPNRREQTL